MASGSDDDEEKKRVQITVWANPEKRDEWDEIASEWGFESRGAMIRTAVSFFRVERQNRVQNKLIIDRLDDIGDTTSRTESKVDSVKIDQLEQQDMDDIASEVGYEVMNQVVNLLGDVDSVEEIESRGVDDV